MSSANRKYASFKIYFLYNSKTLVRHTTSTKSVNNLTEFKPKWALLVMGVSQDPRQLIFQNIS